MKNYLMIGCAALAVIGCAHNRGGVGEDSQRQTSYDRNFKMPKSSEAIGAPANSSSTSTNSGTYNSSSQDNQSPVNDSTPKN